MKLFPGRKFRIAFLVSVVCGVVTGCALDQPTHLNASRVQVVEDRFEETVSVSEMDEDYVAALSKHYTRYGAGGIEMSILYNPKSSVNTAMKATNEMARLSAALRRNGLNDVQANILPVNDGAEELHAIVSFASYTARPPADCTVMPGLDDKEDVSFKEDYRLGCSVETMVARQVARPPDLLGRGQDSATTDGRRASNIVDTYRTGAPNESLEGESASGE